MKLGFLQNRSQAFLEQTLIDADLLTQSPSKANSLIDEAEALTVSGVETVEPQEVEDGPSKADGDSERGKALEDLARAREVLQEARDTPDN